MTRGVLEPSYRWTCHRCEAVNDAGTSQCARCGFKAVASAEEIARAKEPAVPARPNATSQDRSATPWEGGMRALWELGRVLGAFAIGVGAIYYGWSGVINASVVVPGRRQAAFYVPWSEHPNWFIVVVICWLAFGALMIFVAWKWAFSDDPIPDRES